MLKMPQVEAATSGIGFGFANNSSNQATIFLQLKPLSERHGVENSSLALQYALYQQFQKIPNVTALPANPPAIPGLGSTGGFAIEVQDINNLGLPALNKVGNKVLADAKADPVLSQMRLPTIFTGSYLVTEFNRSKALAFGVTPSAFFDTINAHDRIDVRQLLRLRNALVSGHRSSQGRAANLAAGSLAHLRGQFRRQHDAGQSVPPDEDGGRTTSRSCASTNTTRSRSTVSPG